MKFKVWDSEEKKFIKYPLDFFINCHGNLHRLDSNGRELFLCDVRFIPVLSTDKTDKNKVEVFIGDRLRNKNGYEFTVKSAIEGIETCEKIGSKYENKDINV